MSVVIVYKNSTNVQALVIINLQITHHKSTQQKVQDSAREMEDTSSVKNSIIEIESTSVLSR